MKNKFIFAIFGVIILVFVVSFPTINAQSATTTDPQIVIANLLQQLKLLQVQVNAIKLSQNGSKSDIVAEAGYFTHNLDLGSEGTEVKVLQTLFMAYPAVYPSGIISGYYGELTKEALKRLQKENNLTQTGKVDSKTLVMLNRLLETYPITLDSGIAESSESQYVAPEIEWVTFTRDITGTTASIEVLANKNTTSVFWYGTSTPINTNTAQKIVSATSSMLHSFNLTGLVPNLTYYYIVKVSDSVNTATSTGYSTK